MNTRKIFAALVVLGLMAIVSVACAPVPTPAPVPTVAPTQAPAAPITVVDGAGRSVTISTAPQRIVSLAPSTTEIAFALGIGNRVVAIDNWSDFPAETKNLPKINPMPLNLEQVVSFKPDLVLVAGITNPDDIKKLADLKLTVVVVGAPIVSFDSIAADITLVGKSTGTEAKAKAVTDSIKQKIDGVKAKTATAASKPKVYWELDATDPAKPYTPGPGSFLNDLIALAGGANAAANAKSAWAQISAEEVIAANPDLIILSDAFFGITPESVKARKGWNVINAVKNDKVFPIDDNLVSRPGPRIGEGLEAAAKLIHPELFK